MSAGAHTHSEIHSQPEVWNDALTIFDAREAELKTMVAAGMLERVVVIGCGSTHYLALTAAFLLRDAGIDARAFPASEILLFPDAIFPREGPYALLAISRSGRTTETLLAAERFRDETGGPIVAVACDGRSPLALSADVTFAIDSAGERSVAQTRSFSGMCVLLQQMAASLAGRNRESSARLPSLCQDLLDGYGELTEALGHNSGIERFFFLGSGMLYGIACEAMLKMKEMSLSYSEAYHTLEFRHGPMSMAGESALVVGLTSRRSAQQETQVLQEMRQLGATVLAIGETSKAFARQEFWPDDFPAWNSPALYLPPAQLLAFHRALRNGQDPDNPQNLSAVVTLEELG